MSKITFFSKTIHIKIKFVDMDNWSPILKPIEVKGKEGKTIDCSINNQLEEAKKQGYELASNELEQDGQRKKFSSDNDEYIIGFHHGQAIIDAMHPGYGYTKGQLEKTITQIVHYQGASSKTPIDNKISRVLRRKLIIDKVNGKIINDSGWNNQGYFKLIATPVVPGFKADHLIAGGGKIDPHNPVQNYVVEYALNNEPVSERQTAKIQYVDILNNNRVILSDEVVGKANDWIEYDPQNRITELRKNGYELVDNAFNANGNVQFFGDSNEEFVFIITMKHTFINVDIKHPFDKILPKQYLKAVNFRVVFQGAGILTPDEITQTAILNRSLKVIPETGRVLSKTRWFSDIDSFHDVKVPVVEGFVADKLKIKAPEIVPSDIIVTVNYIDAMVAKLKKAEKRLQEQKKLEMAIITFIDIDKNGTQIMTSGAITGQPGESINDSYSTKEPLKTLKNEGYEVVFNNFDIPGMVQRFDNNDLQPQVFTIGLKKVAQIESNLKIVRDKSEATIIK